MNRNRKMKVVTYSLAAGLLIGSASFASVAAPLAGATAVLSTDVETQTEANSYSTLSGINLAMAGMLSTATTEAQTEVTESETEAVASEENKNEAADYTGIAIAQVDNYVNVRSEASEEGEVLGKLYNNSAAEVLATEGDWYKISSGSVTGYVKSEFVVTDNPELAASVSTRLATVNTETLYVRADASTDAEIISMVPSGDDLTVTDESTLDSGWVKVSTEDGDGYVSTDYVALSTEYIYAESKEEEEARLEKEEAERKAAEEAAAAAVSSRSSKSSSSSSSGRSYSAPSGTSGSAVASYACQFVGNPYVYGGSSLTNGTDCSGFVMSVYAAFGVSLPHSSSADRSVGYAVSTDAMQPGDIVCYSGHVAIYVGNGTIVHASNPTNGICYSSVNYRSILAVRRIF